MGYLLKEALKTLCGVNQWAYAVFWKLGCQNPQLLIWEECYFESASCSGLPGLSGYESYNINLDSLGISDLQSSVEAPDKVHLLVDKMMVDNHVNIVGEGLVGRVAFTGHHQWILSENYYREAHPPEVLKEVCPQFSVGMQTVAVIPVLPHGVVQFGSFSTIMENLGFLNDVTSLVSSVLLPKDVAANELAPKIGVPVCLGNSAAGGLSLKSNVIDPPGSFDSFNYVGNSCQTTMADSQTSFSLAREFQNELQTNGAASQASNSALSNCWPLQCHQEAKTALPVKLDSSTSNQLVNAVSKAEVIPLNSEMWMKEGAFVYAPRSTLDVPPSCSSTLNHSSGTKRCTEQKMISDSGNQGYFNTPNLSTGGLTPAARTDSGLIYCSNGGSTTYMSVESHGLIKGARSNTKTISSMDSVSDVKWAANRNVTPGHPANSDLQNVNFTMEACNSDSIDHLTANSSLSCSSSSKHLHMEQNTIQALDIPVSQFNEHLNMGAFVPGIVEDDNKHKFGGHIPSVNNTIYEDSYVQAESGSDLFDVFGPDFKNKLLGSYWNSGSRNQSAPTKLYSDNDNLLSKKGLACSEIYSTKGNSDSGIFSSAGTDNLLEAVVSRVHPSATRSMDDKVSCRTILTDMSSSSLTNTSLPYGHFGVSDHMKGELFGVPKYLAGVGVMSSSFSKEESGACSQGSSIYGSQISSWLEKDQKAKPSNSVSTGHSKKPEETGKSNRRRLKPGENPRPRPKDRQMIQDRVKELREIVPNGAKCSIDALLERTIKHMLFLQSVMKHADKLKETGESKIVSKDGGLLLKDNFEGGATWAYEVGSQSMVCPIIVEDLNRPHQMLVEMLCEERGWFLEIADIIRGLGLTILKGVMEARNEKIWARFAVEANRDVTRMQIFISLVRFLEQSAKGGAAQQNGISSENPMAAQQCHQAASVPITGRSP